MLKHIRMYLENQTRQQLVSQISNSLYCSIFKKIVYNIPFRRGGGLKIYNLLPFIHIANNANIYYK